MNSIGFLKSTKDNEKRVALLPKHFNRIKNITQLVFEEGYGLDFGIKDDVYKKAGASVLPKKEVYHCDCICDPKIGDGEYVSDLPSNKILFGYFHAVQNRKLTDILIENKHTCYAWEDMDYQGRHVFWRNNEIAGEAAILHAFTVYGKLPYKLKVAIIGRGNVARGATNILNKLGAEITVYNRSTEKLLSKEINQYDVIVNAVLWDTSRNDHIVYKKDLEKMKRDAYIIDISCDRNGAIETCIPTKMDNPTYVVNGVRHYCVDHTPSILFKEASESFSIELVNYLDFIIENKIEESPVLVNSRIIDSGKIVDQRINNYQNR